MVPLAACACVFVRVFVCMSLSLCLFFALPVLGDCVSGVQCIVFVWCDYRENGYGGLTSECHAFMRQTHHSRSDGNNNGKTRSSLLPIRNFHAKDSIRRQSRHTTYTDFHQINVALARVPSFALLCFINTCATVFRKGGLCTYKKTTRRYARFSE